MAEEYEKKFLKRINLVVTSQKKGLLATSEADYLLYCILSDYREAKKRKELKTWLEHHSH